MGSFTNTTYDVGVVRAADADIKANVENQSLVTDIGVPVDQEDPLKLRDGPSMPNAKTRAHKDGPTPYNPKTGATGYYQR